MINTPQQEMVPLSTLKGAEYNPRSMPDGVMRKLMTSLVEFGLVQPIVARREDDLILGGHQRVEAFKRVLAEQGTTDLTGIMVPVIYLEGLDDTKAKALNLALNKISGDWDYEKLALVLDEITKTDDVSVLLAGFEAVEVQDILGLLGPDSIADDAKNTNVDDELAKQSLVFSFTVASPEEAALVSSVLKQYGMTGFKDMSEAFVNAMKAAATTGVANAGNKAPGD